MRKKLGILLSIAVLAVTALTGCGEGKGASSNKGVKILLSVNEMDTFRQVLVDAAKDKAAAEGVQLDVMDAEGSIEKQVEHMKTAVKEKYDVILCSAVSIDTVVELKASAEKIPMVFFNSCPDEKQLKEGQYIYVGSDEKVAGQYQAEYILDKMSGKEEANVVILKGPQGHSATNGRTKGMKNALADSGKKINYVFEDYANWSQEEAKAMFEVFLKTGVKADYVICNNDSMALGVVEAWQEAGKDFSEMSVLGVDATADGCAAIEKGEMAFTVYQSATGQGEAAVEAAIKLAGGESIDSMEGVSEDNMYVWVPFEKVDSSNVSEYGK